MYKYFFFPNAYIVGKLIIIRVLCVKGINRFEFVCANTIGYKNTEL